jgi:DNA-binding NarL/FixJ family response regulator
MLHSSPDTPAQFASPASEHPARQRLDERPDIPGPAQAAGLPPFDPASPRRSKVLVRHREPLLRAGIAAALRAHAGFDVSVDGDDESRGATAGFDVIVTDYDDGLRLAGESGRAPPGAPPAARVLVLTTFDREADIRRAVVAGVHGYLVRGTDPAELVEGVAAAARGARYWCRTAALRMLDSQAHADLTEREVQVLQLVADGEPNKSIARQLQIEVGTVKAHMSAIMTKLHATSRTHAARIGTARGLVRERVPAQA